MFMILVPAYNEAKTIVTVVKDLLSISDAVLVIDDGSTDATAELARASGAIVLRHRLNRGQGAALETGHVFARERGATYVAHFDADGQFDAADIPAAFQTVRSGKVDIVLGSRFLGGEESVPFFKRMLVLPVARLIDKMFGSVSLTDAHNGFRVMNKQALDVLRLTQDRMAHASEIPQLIKKHALQYIELPVSVSYKEFGQGPVGGFRVLRDLLIGKFI